MRSTSRETPLERHRRVQAESEETGFVLDRRRLRALGVTRFHVAAQTAAGRWTTAGRQTVSTRVGPLSDLGARWRAVWEAGENIALVDGVSALQANGLKGWTDDVVHISAVHNHNLAPISGVVVHKVIRRVEGESAGASLPRTRPAVAAIRAAQWAVTDRQAATIMAMTVQQRLATGAQLLRAQQMIRGRRRRGFIRRIARDIADGAQALGELEFAEACRRRGLPEPTRQSLRVLPGGRAYLDVYFEEYGLVVEIDGAGHLWGLGRVDDNLRDNAVVIDGDRVLRINVIGLRLEEGRCIDQVAAALRSEWAQANLARHRATRVDVQT